MTDKRGHFVAILVWVLMLLAISPLAWSDEDADRIKEYKVKAAFLYNLARMIEWPENTYRPNGGEAADNPFIICFIGKNRFGDTTDTIKDKKVRGRAIELKQNTLLAEVSFCHILFVAKTEQSNLMDIARLLNNQPVLTVGEFEEFAKLGGMVNLIKRDGKIRLEINQTMADCANLKISARLLVLAKRYEQGLEGVCE